MMRCVCVWEAVLGHVQQLCVVFVLQTVSQMFPHAERGSMAGGQCEQQHTDSNWERTWREKYSIQGTSISIYFALRYSINLLENVVNVPDSPRQ